MCTEVDESELARERAPKLRRTAVSKFPTPVISTLCEPSRSELLATVASMTAAASEASESN